MVINKKEAFAQRLNELLDDAGFVSGRGRQTELGKLIGVSQRAARKWLTGESIPEYERMLKIVEWAKCNYEWLQTGNGSKRPLEFGVISLDEWKKSAAVNDIDEEKVKQIIYEMGRIIIDEGVSINKQTRINIEAEIYQEISDLNEPDVSVILIRKLILLILKERKLV